MTCFEGPAASGVFRMSNQETPDRVIRCIKHFAKARVVWSGSQDEIEKIRVKRKARAEISERALGSCSFRIRRGESLHRRRESRHRLHRRRCAIRHRLRHGSRRHQSLRQSCGSARSKNATERSNYGLVLSKSARARSSSGLARNTTARSSCGSGPSTNATAPGKTGCCLTARSNRTAGCCSTAHSSARAARTSGCCCRWNTTADYCRPANWSASPCCRARYSSRTAPTADDLPESRVRSG